MRQSKRNEIYKLTTFVVVAPMWAPFPERNRDGEKIPESFLLKEGATFADPVGRGVGTLEDK